MKRRKTCKETDKFKIDKDRRMINIKPFRNNNNINEDINDIPNINRYNSVVVNGEDALLFNKPNGMENNGLNYNYDSNSNYKRLFEMQRSNNNDSDYYINEIKENEEYNKKDKTQRTNTINLNTMKIKNFELKLIDFGCAKIFSKHKKNFEDTIGTLIYCSPEVLKNNYNKKCDIWSCGVLMYVLLSGHFPFFGKTEEEIRKKILSGKFIFNSKYFIYRRSIKTRIFRR